MMIIIEIIIEIIMIRGGGLSEVGRGREGGRGEYLGSSLMSSAYMLEHFYYFWIERKKVRGGGSL